MVERKIDRTLKVTDDTKALVDAMESLTVAIEKMGRQLRKWQS
jgi:hypothetical protein|tara:strand:- start:1015 stop:1143 length:129 start_codon:yes stop_codon:yes gene_type:complete